MDFQITGKFKSADGISDIAYYILRPKGEVKGVIQLSHGMCEYFRRYDEFSGFMNRNGIAVVGNDHLGHGGSVKSKEDLGWMAEKDGWKFAVKDLYTMTCIAKKEFPHKPYVIFGHSMGSFMTRAYLSDYSEKVNGAIICGTGGKNNLLGIGIILSWIITKICGQKYRSKLIDNLTFGRYCNKLKCAISKKEWLSRDKETVDEYVSNSYCHFIFTASAFYDLFCVNRFVNSKKWASSIKAQIPIFMISGDMDPVGDYGEGVKWVHNQLVKADKNVKLKLYSNARHELLNEVNKEMVYEEILHWMNTKVLN
ncbi:MAG: alpha/beta fold hydrolase [Aminipila sp.]